MFAIFIQDKQRQEAKTSLILKSTPDVMKADSVRFEHEKCQVSTGHLFVVMTDRDFLDFNSLAENEIVLSLMDHKGLMGESVALLRLFNHHFSFSRRAGIYIYIHPKKKKSGRVIRCWFPPLHSPPRLPLSPLFFISWLQEFFCKYSFYYPRNRVMSLFGRFGCFWSLFERFVSVS